MVDIHCHILPGVDDGAPSMDVAVEMCRLAIADGITHSVLTPHANDEFTYSRERFQIILEQLQSAVGDGLTLLLGCDFHLSVDNILDALANPSRYCIGQTKYLLIEFSDYGLPPAVDSALKKMIDSGLKPIITHPERNPFFQRDPEQLRRLVQSGCLVQVTASALTGYWGPQAAKAARWLLEKQLVHVLASDAHDTVRRPPRLSDGRAEAAKLVGEQKAAALVEANPLAIVEGRAVA